MMLYRCSRSRILEYTSEGSAPLLCDAREDSCSFTLIYPTLRELYFEASRPLALPHWPSAGTYQPLPV
ncbi:hypothetical protein V6N12_074018 [Hibiscus sabdariffa]|uniref:Uncharacterized protein n=1 Tax=Hibiscus sabdariffa TaxID=183260 RepID=A0ABR2BFM3_9ROSI